jgi:hypothetical protein
LQVVNRLRQGPNLGHDILNADPPDYGDHWPERATAKPADATFGPPYIEW